MSNDGIVDLSQLSGNYMFPMLKQLGICLANISLNDIDELVFVMETSFLCGTDWIIKYYLEEGVLISWPGGPCEMIKHGEKI